MRPAVLAAGVASGLVLLALASSASAAPSQERKPAGRDPWPSPEVARRVILRVAKNEGDFDSVNLSDGGGISFGLLQWNQRTGDLGVLLTAMQRAAPQAFAATFGPVSDELTHRLTATDEATRTGPVGGHRLADGPWPDRFRAAGKLEVFQRAQLDLAQSGTHFGAAVAVAKMLGMREERALTLFFDTAVQQGAAGAKSAARSVLRSGVERESRLTAFAHASADRARRGTRPTRKAPTGLAWRQVGDEWRLFMGDRDLYALVLRRRLALLRGSVGADE